MVEVVKNQDKHSHGQHIVWLCWVRQRSDVTHLLISSFSFFHSYNLDSNGISKWLCMSLNPTWCDYKLQFQHDVHGFLSVNSLSQPTLHPSFHCSPPSSLLTPPAHLSMNHDAMYVSTFTCWLKTYLQSSNKLQCFSWTLVLASYTNSTKWLSTQFFCKNQPVS